MLAYCHECMLISAPKMSGCMGNVTLSYLKGYITQRIEVSLFGGANTNLPHIVDVSSHCKCFLSQLKATG